MTGHILLTANSAWGIAHFRRPLIAALRASGRELTVLAPPDDSIALLLEQGCRFLPLEMDLKGLNPVADLALMRRLGRHFRAERPDAVLSYTIKNNIWGAMAAADAGLPFLPNVSGLGTAFLSGGPLQAVAETLYRRAFRHPARVFFQNPEDCAFFLDRRLVQPCQARVIPGSGIDLAYFAPPDGPIADDPPVFLMIGRIIRDKGVVEFAEAARIVKRRHPEARFHLLGATGVANRGAIAAQELAAWQADGLLTHLGTAADVRPHIAAASCVVLPSYREGAPRALMEASSMARPVIATDVPGCRSVVEDGVTGLLCAPRDAGSLAEACLRFLELPPASRKAMGAAGRKRMETLYDERVVVDAYLDAIDPSSCSSGAVRGHITSRMNT
jgi:glycosyltransferase involved in cell wall biosynthesis